MNDWLSARGKPCDVAIRPAFQPARSGCAAAAPEDPEVKEGGSGSPRDGVEQAVSLVSARFSCREMQRGSWERLAYLVPWLLARPVENSHAADCWV